MLDLLDDFVQTVLCTLANFLIGLSMWPGTFIIIRLFLVALVGFGIWKLFFYMFSVSITAN